MFHETAESRRQDSGYRTDREGRWGTPRRVPAKSRRRVSPPISRGRAPGCHLSEQVEDPKLARGLVRREVVETLTPGALIQESWPSPGSRNNFLVAIKPGDESGLAAIDLSTGEFVLETLPADALDEALSRA